jgi:hypothetical protein
MSGTADNSFTSVVRESSDARGSCRVQDPAEPVACTFTRHGFRTKLDDETSSQSVYDESNNNMIRFALARRASMQELI